MVSPYVETSALPRACGPVLTTTHPAVAGGYSPDAKSVSTGRLIVKHSFERLSQYNSGMPNFKSPVTRLAISIVAILLVTLLGPEEKSLGSNVRLVYLHGAWVLTAEILFILAALAGLSGLLLQRDRFHTLSAALGKTGIIFWVTYLPLSMLAMQANWNGLFLAEPRFRLAMIFAVTGVLLQIGLWIYDLPRLTSAANIIYIAALLFSFSRAENIMHPPPSPIFNSGNYLIIGFFIALNLLAWAAAYFLARIFVDQKSISS